MSWLTTLMRRKTHEQELDRELRFHLETQIAENLRAGMTPTEAHRHAVLEFGAVESIKEECRDLQTGRWLETTSQDVRFGWRSLVRAPGFTATAVATIAIGIGANTAIFSFLNGVFLKPVPYPDADRIVALVEWSPGGEWSPIAAPTYLDWARENTVFEHIATMRSREVALTGIEIPVHLLEQQVTAHFFDIFRIQPAYGRAFLEGEDQSGRDAVAILSNRVWVSRFAADPLVVGRKILLDGKPTTVIGVMPPGVLDRSWPEIYRPLVFASDQLSRSSRDLIPAYALLKRGVTLKQARAQMDLIAARIARQYPDSNKGWGVNTMMYTGTLVGGDQKQSLFVLMAAVGMVLLIACANLANLTLARGIAREREMSIRVALGAGRWRLVRQLLTESMLLAFGGGALGLLVGYAGIALLRNSPPGGSMPPTVTVDIDERVLVFALGLSLVTGIVFGLVPAMKIARVDLTPGTREGGPGMSHGRAIHRLRSALIIAEVALAFVLLSGAGLLIRSFFQMQHVDSGFDSNHLATAYLPISEKRFRTGDELNLYLHEVVARVGSLPGVSDVALTTAPPVNWGWGFGAAFQIAGRPSVAMADRPKCGFKVVTASYFRTLGMKLLRGRLLDDRDVKGGLSATVISESMAKKYFADGSPLGQHVLVQDMTFFATARPREVSWEVVGIVRDERNGSVRNGDIPGMYVCGEQSAAIWQFLVVRGAIDPAQLERSMRLSLRELSGDQVMDDLITFDEVKSNSVASERRLSWLLAIFALVALLLAGMGLYGVISYSVAQRTRELGIRTALGATPSNIVGLVVRSAMAVTGIGLVLGIGGALGLSRLIASLLFNVGRYDPATLTLVGAVLATTSLVACCIPARRAARVNPITALRCE